MWSDDVSADKFSNAFSFIMCCYGKYCFFFSICFLKQENVAFAGHFHLSFNEKFIYDFFPINDLIVFYPILLKFNIKCYFKCRNMYIYCDIELFFKIFRSFACII